MNLNAENNIDRLIYAFIAIRVFIDLVLVAIMSVQRGSLIAGGAMWLLCWVFYLFLFFGTRTETFHGRYGSKVYRWREPAACWFVFGFIALFHLVITTLFAYAAIDWPRLLS